jgi:hypothetical protein
MVVGFDRNHLTTFVKKMTLKSVRSAVTDEATMTTTKQ